MTTQSRRYNYAPSRNTIGLAALILVLIGAVATLAVFAVPFLLFLAIPILIVAFILAIIGLTRRDQTKATSIWALILSIVFGILGPILFAGSFLNFVGNEIGGVAVSGAPADDAVVAGIGETVTNSAGVDFIVDGTECGIASMENHYGAPEAATSQFCTVTLHIMNGSNSPFSLHSTEATALIGDAVYEANPFIGGASIVDIGPGLEGSTTFAFDVPAEATLDYIELKPMMSSDGIIVSLK